jgi:hypothetical protein
LIGRQWLIKTRSIHVQERSYTPPAMCFRAINAQIFAQVCD